MISEGTERHLTFSNNDTKIFNNCFKKNFVCKQWMFLDVDICGVRINSQQKM